MSDLHTLESLGKLYTDAAKAGGMENWAVSRWKTAGNGPNLNSRVDHYRPKPKTVVKYSLKFSDGKAPNYTFDTKEEASIFLKAQASRFSLSVTIIKLQELT